MQMYGDTERDYIYLCTELFLSSTYYDNIIFYDTK